MLVFEDFAKTVELFTRKNEETEDFETDIGTATLRYVLNGDPQFKDAINGLFKYDAYKKHPGDFILFYIKGELLAVSTYTPAFGCAMEVEEVDDMVAAFWVEYLAAVNPTGT